MPNHTLSAPSPGLAAGPPQLSACPACYGRGYTWGWVSLMTSAPAECPACAGTGIRAHDARVLPPHTLSDAARLAGARGSLSTLTGTGASSLLPSPATSHVRRVLSPPPPEKMKTELILGLLRHALTFGGGLLVASGMTSPGETEELIGGVVSTVGLAWSFARKIRRAKSAPATPPPQ